MDSEDKDRVAALIAAARSGDGRAWDELYAIHERQLRARVRYRLAHRHRAEADDVLQSAWCEAVGDLHTFEYRGRESFLAWVTGILQHKISRIDRRDRRRAPAVEGSEGQALIAARAASRVGPGTEAGQAEELRRLRSAVEHLPAEQRRILRLARFQKLKNREIGALLGISEGAARMRLVRAETNLTRVFRRMRREGHE